MDERADTSRSQATPAAKSGNFGVVVAEGIAANTAGQLSNAAVVLPFICVALGGPILAAALIYPAYVVFNLVGTLVSPALLDPRRTSKLILTACAIAGAVVTVVNALGAEFLGSTMATAFVATAAALGFLFGLSAVCFVDVVADALHQHEHARLWIFQNAGSAAVVLIITTVDLLLFGGADTADGHLRLLWLAAGAMVVAAVCCGLIVLESHAPRPRISFRSSLHTGIALLRRRGWFRRFLLVQSLFLTTSLGTAFYSAHSATEHGNTSGSLHVIVACTAGGLVLFAVVWHRLRHRLGLRAMYTLAGGLGLAAAALTIVADRLDEPDAPWLYGIIMALAAVAALAVSSSRTVWMLRRATSERLVVISFSQLVVGVISAPIAGLLAVLAQIHGTIVPIVCVAVLNVLALAAIRWVPRMSLVHPVAST